MVVDYDCMGNMEGHLVNAAPTHWWKSPRWIVIRIEALAVVAIIFSFFLAIFGSCRRWSNSWVVQKGFLVAQVLSLSLGTYSIGLMQSSSVKSEMYPIWTVSLFTLFGCIDPVTTYNGLDYKGPLSKMVYGICLNSGYVLLMSISTITNVVGNAAIFTLSAITFLKSFHRSFALVEQKQLCDMVHIDSDDGEAHIFTKEERHCITADIGRGICGADIEESTRKWLLSCYDVLVALRLSHKLRHYFLGLDYHVPDSLIILKDMDLNWALKIIEIELAFVYDALFTGNPFLHYYQAKTASLWALASFSGICFVLVATAIPGGMSSKRPGDNDGCNKVVDTTTADLAITFGILVSLALLQVMQLVQYWTSNWAIATVVCAYTREDEKILPEIESQRLQWGYLKQSGWMRLKALVATSTNLFDKYLWQDKIGQYSMLPEPRLLTGGQKKGAGISSSGTERKRIWSSEIKGELKWGRLIRAGWWRRKYEQGHTKGEWILRRCGHLVQTLGLHYIWQVTWELLSSGTNKRAAVKLDEDVKGSVINFLGQLESDRLDWNLFSSFPEEPGIRYFLPQLCAPKLDRAENHCYRYISCVMTWHIATWYCELAEQKRQDDAVMSKRAEAPICCGTETAASSYYLRKAAAAIRRPGIYFQQKRRGGGGTKTRDHRRVANALSQYCTYLVKSAPELLPGPVGWAKRVYDHFARCASVIVNYAATEDAKVIIRKNPKMDLITDRIVCSEWKAQKMDHPDREMDRFSNGMALAKLLMHGRSSGELWKTLALVWVQLLVYAAPYGNVEAHIRHLSQGGEFITHLWALLYHLDIREWKVLDKHDLHDISTVEDAQRILNDDDHPFIVVFFARSDVYRLDLDTVSTLVDDVKFCRTSSHDVAKCLYIRPRLQASSRVLVFLNKADKKITIYDPEVYGREYTPWDVAQFVYENKLASAKARADGTAPSTSHNPIPIEKQRSEEGETEGEITMEIKPDFSNYTFGPYTPPTQMPAAPQNLAATIQEWEIPSTTTLQPVNTRRATPYPTTRNTVLNAVPPQTQASVGGVPERHEEVEVPYVQDAVDEDNLEVNDNLHDISTINDDDHDLDIVVFFADSVCPDGFVAASKLVHGVKFYFTSSPDVAKCLYFPESILQSSKSLLFLNKADKKITFYDRVVHGSYTPWNVARFVYENKLASAKARSQGTATPHNPIPIEKQTSEEEQTEGEITEEIQPAS